MREAAGKHFGEIPRVYFQHCAGTFVAQELGQKKAI